MGNTLAVVTQMASVEPSRNTHVLALQEGTGKKGERFEVGTGLSCPEKLRRKGNWIFIINSVTSNL